MLVGDGFHRLFPTEQLTKLTINYELKIFHDVIKILLKTLNVHTLTVACRQLVVEALASLQESEAYRLISKQNKIRNMTFRNEYRLKTIQLLVDLFPQLQHLTLGISRQSLEGTVRFLLSKYNKTPCHVSSLCIFGVDRTWTEKVKLVVELKKHDGNYSLKVVNQILYLWWCDTLLCRFIRNKSK
jgi:hypothetical protein